MRLVLIRRIDPIVRVDSRRGSRTDFRQGRLGNRSMQTEAGALQKILDVHALSSAVLPQEQVDRESIMPKIALNYSSVSAGHSVLKRCNSRAW